MQKFAAGKFNFEPPSPFTSFDDLVGAGEKHRRKLDAERLGGLKVEYQFEFDWLLNRQIGGLGTFQDAAGVDANLVIGIRNIGSVAHQPAGFSIVANCVARGKRMARRLEGKLPAPAIEEGVGTDE